MLSVLSTDLSDTCMDVDGSMVPSAVSQHSIYNDNRGYSTSVDTSACYMPNPDEVMLTKEESAKFMAFVSEDDCPIVVGGGAWEPSQSLNSILIKLCVQRTRPVYLIINTNPAKDVPFSIPVFPNGPSIVYTQESFEVGNYHSGRRCRIFSLI